MMAALDGLNERFGHGTVQLAALGPKGSEGKFKNRRDWLSGASTWPSSC
ncbi:DUF4113 domain-containing protein [Hymenobacter sp.]|jgi:hypothetical protein